MHLRNKAENKGFCELFTTTLLLAGLIFVWQPLSVAAQGASSAVILQRTPDGGIQPQAVVDSKQIVHLIYYKGDPQAGNIYYVRQDMKGNLLSTPLRVNSQPDSAVAMGWVRGAQIAIGKSDRVHIIWNGSGKAEPRGVGGKPMLYTRLNNQGTAFEPQRNLITWAGGIDGGGALAADNAGIVYVFWHAAAGESKDDASADVFAARSMDDGKNFAREEKVNTSRTGACGCCAMKAFIDKQGILYLLYRSAGENLNRDTMLLISRDKGKNFVSSTLSPWQLEACPLTVYSISQDSSTGAVFGAWKTKEQIYFAALNSEGRNTSPAPFSPSVGAAKGDRKYQVIAVNKNGEKLLAWVEGASWGKGGSLAWQVFDKDGKSLGEREHTEGVPAWSLITAFARPDGRFGLVF